MRTVEHSEEIRRAYYHEKKSIRAIAREQGHGRDVIRAAIAGTAPEPPRYRLRGTKPQPVRETIALIADAWLEADRDAPRKQRHTAKRVYERLVAERGYTGSERTVRLYVQTWKKAHRSAAVGFVPLAYAPGAEAQCDGGEALVRIAGVEHKASLFCLRLC